MSAGHIEDIYELSPLQQGVLFHTLYDGGTDVYINQRTFMIDGSLDTAALLSAWQQATDAHPAVRTTFHWDGLDKPLQVVHHSVPAVVHRYDWSGLPDQNERLDRLLAEDLAAGFDPAVPPLQRLSLVRLGDDQHGLIWTHHLLLLDGWSVPIFIGDVVRRYQELTVGGAAPEPSPPYRNYIAWLQEQDMAAARAFWTDTLGGSAEATPLAPLLPGDPQRPAGPIGDLTASLPPPVEAGLRSLAARHGITVNTVLQAAWALVLQHFSGESEVTIGVTSSCRPPELPGVERMVGLFTNSLPVRVPVPDDGDLGQWLRDIQARYTAIRRYEYSPLAQIKQWVGATGDRQLFHSLLVFDNYSLAVVGGEIDRRLSIRGIEVVEKTTYPLVITVAPEPAFALHLFYHCDRVTPGGAQDILACFETVLGALVTAERIAPVAAALEPALEAPDTTVRYADADRTLPELIERQAAATPDALAVLADDEAVSYGELLGRARKVAAALSANGVGPGDVVGVCADRSTDMVSCLVGTLLAGAAYLPLEPSLPAARLTVMVRDSRVDTVLTHRGAERMAHQIGVPHVLTMEDLPAADGFTRPTVGRHDAAYVLYTSGSTGRPKGVVITHAAIVNRVLWMQDTFRLSRADRVLHKTPIGFDVSVWELFWPLVTGATMVLARPGGHQDAEYLARTIAQQEVTVSHFVPSMLQLFLDEPTAVDLPALRRVVCSGEELPPALVQRFRQRLPTVELHNLYGPTEAAVDVTWWDCARPAPPGTVPIGHPIANTTAYVLDRRLRCVPVGVPGELYLGGIQLARGYHNRPDLTAAAFVAHPLAGPGGRLYRTGDSARILPDGSVQFLGRLDRQVKLRGYRIELGEIEHVLASHPAVREAAVAVRPGPDGTQLVAYVTASGSTGPDANTLRGHLQCQLPGYMLPASFTVLPAMPRSHNGKLDRAALPDPAPVVRSHRAAPATPREELIAAAYREVLDISEVDVTASFFDLGGNSFDAVRVIRRIEGANVGLLVAHPSVRALATALLKQEDADRRLLRLTESGLTSHSLVCVPYGGGSAITYQPLARVLSPEIALYAIALPGHEVGGEPELRSIEDVAADCVAAVDKIDDGPVSVYGHCAGVALAVELVRQLEAAGRSVERLFVGGAFPFYEPGPIGRRLQRYLGALVTRGVVRVSANTVGMTRNGSAAADTAEMRFLQSSGGFDGEMDDEGLAFVMRAFRHDVAEAPRYFSTHGPRRHDKPVLAAPITFIAGTADPFTPGFERRGRNWERYSSTVEVVTVADGGHYFHQHQPEAVARIIEKGIVAK